MPLTTWPGIPWPMVAVLSVLACTSVALLMGSLRYAVIGAIVAVILGKACGLQSGPAAGLLAVACLLDLQNRAPKAVQRWSPRIIVLFNPWVLWLSAAWVMLGATDALWLGGMQVKPDAVAFVPEVRLQHVVAAVALALASREAWARSPGPARLWHLRGALAPTVCVVVILMGLALRAGVIRYELAPWGLVPLFVLHNMALVVVPEEVLFRGALQQCLRGSVPLRWRTGPRICALSAAVFALGHLPHGPLLACLSFVAGLGYGAAYVRTKSLWGCVMSHVAVNVVHFVWFSYPALR